MKEVIPQDFGHITHNCLEMESEYTNILYGLSSNNCPPHDPPKKGKEKKIHLSLMLFRFTPTMHLEQ